MPRELESTTETWRMDDSKVVFKVHRKKDCEAPCPLHAPTEHHMRDLPLTYNQGKNCFERMCSHNVPHPDPDTRLDEDDEDEDHDCCSQDCCAYGEEDRPVPPSWWVDKVANGHASTEPIPLPPRTRPSPEKKPVSPTSPKSLTPGTWVKIHARGIAGVRHSGGKWYVVKANPCPMDHDPTCFAVLVRPDEPSECRGGAEGDGWWHTQADDIDRLGDPPKPGDILAINGNKADTSTQNLGVVIGFVDWYRIKVESADGLIAVINIDPDGVYPTSQQPKAGVLFRSAREQHVKAWGVKLDGLADGSLKSSPGEDTSAPTSTKREWYDEPGD